MTSFFLQLLNLFNDGRVQIFLIFFILVQAFWWLRVYIASKNKRYTKTFKGSMSVLVAVLREDPKIFEASLSSIKKFGKPTEFIVSIDDYSHADKEIKRIAKKYATRVLQQPSLVGKREQYALASEALKKDVDVIVTVDSDTIWDKSTINFLKPFNNPKVGAVSGRQTIFDIDRNYIRRIAQWFEDLRFRVTLPFQSYFGQVNVVPGRALAARADLYKEIAQKVRNETFLGRRIITSDDASVTMEVLKAGYDVVYQDDSNVTTDAPNTFHGFMKQYLRWYRGAYRRFFSRFDQLIRMNPLVFLSNLEFLFATFIYSGILLTFIFKLVFDVYIFDGTFGFAITESFNPVFIALLVLGYFVSSYLRNLPHLLHEKRDFLFLPVFAVFTFITMALLKIAAAFTMFENGWMTRSSNTKHQEKGLTITRIYAGFLALAILVLTFPLAYIIDIVPTNVPFGVIVAHEGPTYYKAREIIASYKTNTAEESLTNIEHLYEQYKTVKTDNKLAATCVRDRLTDAPQDFSQEKPLELINYCAKLATNGDYRPQEVAKTETKNEDSLKNTAQQPYILTAQNGDSQSILVRALINSQQQSRDLSNAQKVFLENRLVNLLGNNDSIDPGQTFTISKDQLTTFVQQSQQLSLDYLNAWSMYL